ncbi:acyltransferase [Mycobacterium sp.]|uniref:acyltransferase family protein n=1 Tax=Mycobacterium sp. TaxID=1785 RepID=UPI0025E02D25|nr:acyltransferase [Mycobacterium sp.]MBW0012064.1 acyltransferase [Mycobacterium sp.]
MSRFFPARIAGSAPLRTSVMPRGSRRDADWLLLIRGVACGLVYIAHSVYAFNRGWVYRHGRWAWILESPAWLGMVLFFTLSGYLMGKGFYTGKYNLSRSGVSMYLRNRFLRIFPLMVVAGLFVVLVLGTIWRPSGPGQRPTPQLGVRIVLFGFNGQGVAVIGPFWSLSTEWQYYLLVPGAFAIALAASRFFTPTRKVLLPIATLLVLAVGVMNRNYVWTQHGGYASYSAYIYPTLFGNIDVFLLGFLANWWVPRLARFSRVIVALWPVLLVGIYLAYSFVSHEALAEFARTGDGKQWFRIHAVVMPAAVALALIPVIVGCELWNRKARLRTVPQRKTAFLLFWMGELTYPIYLVHLGILNGVYLAMPGGNYAARWALATMLVVLIAWVLHRVVEEPVLKWRMRRATRTENAMVPGCAPGGGSTHDQSLLRLSEPDPAHLGAGRVTSTSVIDSLDPVANGDLGGCVRKPVANSVAPEVV